MNRRAVLAGLGGSLAGLAGCFTVTDTTDTPDENETPTDTAITTDQSPTETRTETDGAISVELRHVEYVANAYEPASGRGIDPDDVVPAEEISDVLREALYEARAGGFETESLPDGLLAAIDEFRTYATGVLKPYVELDGTSYEFDPTVPTFVAELEEDTLDDYDEDRLLRADERRDLESEAVESFVRALTARGPEIPRSEYRRSAVPEAVAAFLDEYDYLEDQHGVSRITTIVRHADPPYTITLHELTTEDMWGQPVVEEAALDGELVAFFERVLDSEHRKPALPSPDRRQYFTGEVPEAYSGFADEYESPPYVRLDGTVYNIVVGQPRYERIPVSVSIEEADAASRAFTLTVSPAPGKPDDEIEGPFTFTGRGALPSVLWVVHDGERYLLDSPGYETAGWRDAPADSKRDRRPSNQVLESVHANEELSATYTVPDVLPEGTYVSRGLFYLSWSVPDRTPGDHAAYPFELLVTIEAG